MYGPGIYFAENSSKSNQYIACPKCGGGAISKKNPVTRKPIPCNCGDPDIEYCIILSRVCLGNPYVSVSYEHWKNDKENRLLKDSENYQPIPKVGCDLCSITQHCTPPTQHNNVVEAKESGHDSVCAVSEDQHDNSILRNREFIVYDKRQTYPEYIITFKRK
jgi:hypothetical protein